MALIPEYVQSDLIIKEGLNKMTIVLGRKSMNQTRVSSKAKTLFGKWRIAEEEAKQKQVEKIKWVLMKSFGKQREKIKL